MKVERYVAVDPKGDVVDGVFHTTKERAWAALFGGRYSFDEIPEGFVARMMDTGWCVDKLIFDTMDLFRNEPREPGPTLEERVTAVEEENQRLRALVENLAEKFKDQLDYLAKSD